MEAEPEPEPEPEPEVEVEANAEAAHRALSDTSPDDEANDDGDSSK